KVIINKSQTSISLDDNMIAIAGAIALFICPAGKDLITKEKAVENKRILEWEDTSKMAWGILVLFGGGIALADALEKAGLIKQLGAWLALYAGSGFGLVLIVVIISIILITLFCWYVLPLLIKI